MGTVLDTIKAIKLAQRPSDRLVFFADGDGIFCIVSAAT